MTWADTQKAQSTLWTPERVEKLKELWAAGWSASECAGPLGTTRNAVIGKVHRLRLPKRRPTVVARKRSIYADGERPVRIRNRAKAAPKPKPARVPPRPKIVEPPPPRFEPDPEIMAMDAWLPLPGTTPITDIMLINDSTCRWPIGDPLAPGFGYCGCETAEGSSYCPTHKVRSTGKGTDSERLAVKVAEKIGKVECQVRREAA